MLNQQTAYYFVIKTRLVSTAFSLPKFPSSFHIPSIGSSQGSYGLSQGHVARSGQAGWKFLELSLHHHRIEAKREGDTESKGDSRLSAASTELSAGLEPTNHEIMT